jgi:hypothetical protein
MTDFTTRCEILGELYDDYSQQKNFKDFIEFNDIGMPLAYFVSADLCEASDDGIRYINETWDLFLVALDLEDIGYHNLEHVFHEVEDL